MKPDPPPPPAAFASPTAPPNKRPRRLLLVSLQKLIANLIGCLIHTQLPPVTMSPSTATCCIRVADYATEPTTAGDCCLSSSKAPIAIRIGCQIHTQLPTAHEWASPIPNVVTAIAVCLPPKYLNIKVISFIPHRRITFPTNFRCLSCITVIWTSISANLL